jgi:serine/threonine-protein kinase
MWTRILADPSLSGSDIITGTPFYMAPEAIQDPLSVDARTDLYAVGALAYEVVSGRRPFEGRNVVEVLSQQINARPEPPSRRLGRPLPADLESLILECLEKEPGARPQTARALLGRLESLADAGRWTQEEARACWRERASLVAPTAAPSPAPPWATSPTVKAGPRTITGTASGR